jgi:ATP-dependent DNA helicase RecG
VEVTSPGSLPNHLTLENIKTGHSVMRNPLLTSHGTKMMPYSGIGSGVPRVLKKEPSTIFLNEIEGEQYKVTFRRKNLR